jgi:hypothetical protein
MSANWFNSLAIDGDAKPIYSGDTIKYLIDVLDEDKRPFTGTVDGAFFEIMRMCDGMPSPLATPVTKIKDAGINFSPTNQMEVILLPADTAMLPTAVYVSMFKVRSPDFGEMTLARRLKLEQKLGDIPT